MAALIRVDHCLSLQRNPVISLHVFDSLQNEVNLQAVAEHVRQRFLGVGVQDRGQIQKTILKPDVSDVRQQYCSGSVAFKFPVQQIIRYIVCSHGLCHPAIWIGFAYGTKKIVFVHEPADFLGIHHDSHVLQPHMDAANAFLVAPEIVGFQDQGKIRPVLFLPFSPLPSCGLPSVIS